MLRFRLSVLIDTFLPKYTLNNLKCHKTTFTENGQSEYQTMHSIRKKLVKVLETDSMYSMTPKSKDHLSKYVPKSQAELPVRKMKHSFDSAIVPLSTDVDLREKYTTFQGNVRLGRLMEDVDMFAVWCCVKHLSDPDVTEYLPLPYAIVTILIHHIELMTYSKQPVADIRLQGHVCWVGQSSLEVVVYLSQLVKGEWERITRALLLMAARNPTNTGPAIVNALEPETAEERKLFEGGERRKHRRIKMMDESLLKKTPSQEEMQIMHELFINTIDPDETVLGKRALPPSSKWMHDATLNNLVFCHPEHRNLHNKIFGGFLIRQALELSWTIAYLYGMQTPKLIHISDIGFYNPVDVGSLLKLYGSVTYAEKEYIQVFVFAEAFSISSQQVKNTTSFNFTYSFEKEINKLYPTTYLEAMKYIDGRRHFHEYLHFIANPDS